MHGYIKTAKIANIIQLLQMNPQDNSQRNLFSRPASFAPPPRPPPPGQSKPSNNNTSASTLLNQTAPANKPPLPPKTKKSQSNSPHPFHSNPIDNYFTDLLRSLKVTNSLQLNAQLLTSKQIMNWVREGLDQFLPNQQKNKTYLAQYKDKPCLRLSLRDVGFGAASLLPHPYSKKIDAVLARVIESMSVELQTNNLMMVKLMRKLLRQGKFLPALYLNQLSQQVMKPNIKLIDQFFMASDSDVVNQAAMDYQILVAKCMEMFFQQYTACILCLGQFLQLEMEEQQGVERDRMRGLSGMLLKPEYGKPLGCVLWANYCYMADDLLRASLSELQRDQRDYGHSLQLAHSQAKCRQAIIRKKIQLFMYLVRLFQKSVNQNMSIVADTAAKQKNFYQSCITTIDNNILSLQSSSHFTSLHVSVLIRQLTELLLALFPWEHLTDCELSRQRRQSIKEALLATGSSPLRPLRLVAEGEGRGENMLKMLKGMNDALEGEDWPVHSYHWKRWLGLFLRAVQHKVGWGGKFPLVLKHVVWLCKAVMKEEYREFWEVMKGEFQSGETQQVWKSELQNRFYLVQLSQFLKQALSQQRSRHTLTFTQCLPIFTAALGSLRSNYVLPTLNFIKRHSEQALSLYICQHITALLNLDQRNADKSSRIVYSGGEKERNLQQQMKFVCRAVELSAQQLVGVLQLIFNEDPITGFPVVVFLCRCLQRIPPEQPQDLRCLRYLIRALDAVFVNTDTRTMLPLALGVLESAKWSFGRVIRQIVGATISPNGSPDFIRQSRKLRRTYATHTHHVLRVSDSLEQYFPAGSRREDQKRYERLEQYLRNKDYVRINEEFFQREHPPLRAVPWLHSFFLILESDSLTSQDLQNVSQLLVKMRVQSWAKREYANLQVVVEMINNGKLAEAVGQILTPLIVTQPNPEHHLFGLANRKYQGYISQSDAIDSNSRPPARSVTRVDEYLCGVREKGQARGAGGGITAGRAKYASRQYCLVKQKKQREQEVQEIYGLIASSLRVIETVLKLSLQAELELVKKLRLTQWIMESLLGKAPLYSIKFTTKIQKEIVLEKTQNKQQSKRTEIVAAQFDTFINLIHTIVSLIDFQERFSIPEWTHPSCRLKLRGVYYYDLAFFLSNNHSNAHTIDSQVLARSQLNLLSDHSTRDNISVSVLQILTHTMALGLQKQVYSALTNRMYPKNTISNRASAGHILQQFGLALMRILSRQDTTVRVREVCLQFLCVCLKTSRFADFVRAKAYMFRQPLMACLQSMEEAGGLAMTVRLLMFLNLLLSSRPRSEDLRFVKGCLVDVARFGQRLTVLAHSVFRQLRDPPDNMIPYANLLWAKSTLQAAHCKLALLFYTAILSALLTYENLHSAASVADWMMRQSEICMYGGEGVSLKEMDELGVGAARRVEERVERQHQLGFLDFNKNLQGWIIDGQGSLGEDFACRRWEVYHRAVEKDDAWPDSLTLKALRINVQYSLQTVQEALSQFYYTVLLGLFLRGQHGYYFVCGRKQYSKKFTHSISLNGQHSPNNLAGIELLTRSEEWPRKFFSLMREVVEDIWQQGESQCRVARTSGILLLSQLLKSVAEHFRESGNAHIFDSDSVRVLNRIEANLWGRSNKVAEESALVVLLEQMLSLVQAVWLKGMLGMQYSQSSRNYLITISQNYQNILAKMNRQSVLKLSLLVMQLQIQVLLKIESNYKIIHYYLTSAEHKTLMQNLSQGLQCAVRAIQDPAQVDGVRCLAMQMFSKVLQLSSVSHQHCGDSIYRPFMYRLSAKLQILAADQGQSELPSGVFMLGLLAQATASNSNEWMRMAAKVLLCSNSLLRAGKCGAAQSLWQIIEAKQVFATLVAIESIQNWRNQDIGIVFSNLFSLLQQTVQRFEGRVVPSGDMEIQLAHRLALQDYTHSSSSNVFQSIFGVLVELRLHEMLRYFLLFLLSSIRHCLLLAQFCQKTISLGPFQQHTWQRLKMTLQNVGEFLSRFCDHLKINIKQMVIANLAVCQEGAFASLPIRAFFEPYQTEKDLLQDSLQTVVAFVECVHALVTVWRSYDWKARIDWKPSRKQLVFRCMRQVSKWGELAKRIDWEGILKEKMGMLQGLLGDWEGE